MTRYTIIPDADQTFRVAIVGDDGTRQTLLGFASRTEAEAWIAQDRRSTDADEPWTPNHFQTLSEV